MPTRRTLLIGLAVALVLLTAPAFLTIAWLSFLMLDTVDTSMRPITIVAVTNLICFAVPIASLVFSIKMIRKNRTAQGLWIAAIPYVVLAIFWLWLSQQSFS